MNIRWFLLYVVVLAAYLAGAAGVIAFCAYPLGDWLFSTGLHPVGVLGVALLVCILGIAAWLALVIQLAGMFISRAWWWLSR